MQAAALHAGQRAGMTVSTSSRSSRCRPRCCPVAALAPRRVASRAQPPRAAELGAQQPSPPAQDAEAAYEEALELARQEQYDAAAQAFEALLAAHPRMCRAWVSFAQMHRRLGRTRHPSHYDAARAILQRGLSTNPSSGCLAQAWGLMELQAGNLWAAVRLLERSVVMEPVLRPVLRWKPVSVARMTVSSSAAGRRAARASTVCAASSAAGGVGAPGSSGGEAGAAASSGGGGSSGACGGGACLTSM